jgi:hypothetical protein
VRESTPCEHFDGEATAEMNDASTSIKVQIIFGQLAGLKRINFRRTRSHSQEEVLKGKGGHRAPSSNASN